jgi:integrase
MAGGDPMNAIETALSDYLQLRRGLGHQLDDAGRQLSRFVAYLNAIGAETVTMDAVLGFVFDPDLNPASKTPSKRATAVRGFARYLAGIDAATEIPPAGLVSYRARRRTPHLFSDEDVAAVVRHARRSTLFPFRAETLTALIGLLAVTGMRVGEVLRLGIGDIDWDNAVILVRNTKFHKGRDVPVSASTIEALSAYAEHRDRPRQCAPRLFVSLTGTPVIYHNFRRTFHDAITAAGIGNDPAVRPRIHDLRHSFAVRTLLGWHRAGLDVEALLPRLSTYLGHREPRFTYCYLSATPELFGYAEARLDAAGSVTP